MAEQPLISVIIPVYNIVDAVETCIKSITAQSYRSFELLLIDDGSVDGTASACDACAATDSRIRVFHKKNAGVSAARNTGLDYARGDYIALVDGDDYIAPFYLQRLLEGMDGAELAMVSHVRVMDQSYTFENPREPFLTIPVADGAERLLAGRFAVSVCGALLKSSVIRELRFEEGLRHNEDKLFLYQYMLRCLDGILGFSNEKLYAYYVRPGSATSKAWNGTMDIVLAADRMCELTSAAKAEWVDLAKANAVTARLSTMKWILTTSDVHDRESNATLSLLYQEVMGMRTSCVTSVRSCVELLVLRLGMGAYKLLVKAYYGFSSEEMRERHNTRMTRQ